MILSGKEITRQRALGKIHIEPYDPKRINPNSYNLRLADELMVYDDYVLDMKKENKGEVIKIPPEGLVLEPNRLYLGRTIEHTTTDGFVPMLEGRSSVGRLGMFIHVTAGFGDVGFSGFWTLEIFCIQPIKIYAGVEICQIYYHTIEGDYDPYDSGKYQKNQGIQPSMMFKDFQEEKNPTTFIMCDYNRCDSRGLLCCRECDDLKCRQRCEIVGECEKRRVLYKVYE